MLEGYPAFRMYALCPDDLDNRPPLTTPLFKFSDLSLLANGGHVQNMQSESYCHHSVAPCPDVRAIILVDKCNKYSN
jgi:hypothetical protein